MSNLFLDIETAPTQDPALIAMLREEADAKLAAALEAVKPHGALKDPEKIAKDLADKRAALINGHAASIQEAYLETALDGGYGQIVSIAFAGDEGPVRDFTVPDLGRASEGELLDRFFRELWQRGRQCLVGHNLVGFDLPFLWKRAIIHNVEPPAWMPSDAKPWDRELTFDTMTCWAGPKGRISLDRLGRLLGLPAKESSGADVWALAQAGDFDAIAAHCRADVERTRAVFRRMTFKLTPDPEQERRINAITRDAVADGVTF